MVQQQEPRVAAPRRAGRIVVRVLGVLAAVATGWVIFMGGVVVGEWPTYVGHESSTALAIYQVVAVVPAVIVWVVFLVALGVVRRRSRGA